MESFKPNLLINSLFWMYMRTALVIVKWKQLINFRTFFYTSFHLFVKPNAYTSAAY